MDAQQRLVPIGVMGELVVTGDGLARGYTDPELDRDRFVEVEIDGQPTRAYRTGDRVRYQPRDGQIEFFGRMDRQIKIRGHRVELAEVEHAMLQQEEVGDAAVVVREREGQGLDMVGFITARHDRVFSQDKGGARGGPYENADEGIDDEVAGAEKSREEPAKTQLERQVRDRLRTLLPSYMVPGRIMVLEQMPINANGKVDRRELTQKAAAVAATMETPRSARVPPRDEVEAAVCEECANVLGVEVGVTDNFFDLGGHSLMATRLAARISRRLDAHVSVKDIFDRPVLADLAGEMRRGSTPHVAIPHLEYSGPVELSFAQGRLWFLDRLNLGATWYLMAIAVRLRGPLRLDALNSALQALEERHESLRTTFEERDGVGVQVVHPFCRKEAKEVKVPADEALLEALRLEQTTAFDLEREPGWRVSVFQQGDEDHVLSIVMHHIISDGWSVDVLCRELAEFYTIALRGREPLSQTAQLPIQYRDFAVWQKQSHQAAEQQRQLQYWTEQLTDSHPAELLCDKPRPAVPSGEAGVVETTIEGPLYRSLQRFCKTRQVTPFVVLLAAFRAAHYRLTGADDATIGTPIANRNRPEVEELVGFFVNTQCMRITVEDESFEGLVQQVRATATAAFANQDVPFERVVSALLPGSRDTSRNPLVQLMFAVHSQRHLGEIHLEGLAGEAVPWDGVNQIRRGVPPVPGSREAERQRAVRERAVRARDRTRHGRGVPGGAAPRPRRASDAGRFAAADRWARGASRQGPARDRADGVPARFEHRRRLPRAGDGVSRRARGQGFIHTADLRRARQAVGCACRMATSTSVCRGDLDRCARAPDPARPSLPSSASLKRT